MASEIDFRPFLSVSEAADALGVSAATVIAAIRQGKLPALQLSDSHRATRIRRSGLFPTDETSLDRRPQRLRRLQAASMQAREFAALKRQEWLEAEWLADQAARQVDAELLLDHIRKLIDTRKLD